MNLVLFSYSLEFLTVRNSFEGGMPTYLCSHLVFMSVKSGAECISGFDGVVGDRIPARVAFIETLVEPTIAASCLRHACLVHRYNSSSIIILLFIIIIISKPRIVVISITVIIIIITVTIFYSSSSSSSSSALSSFSSLWSPQES